MGKGDSDNGKPDAPRPPSVAMGDVMPKWLHLPSAAIVRKETTETCDILPKAFILLLLIKIFSDSVLSERCLLHPSSLSLPFLSFFKGCTVGAVLGPLSRVAAGAIAGAAGASAVLVVLGHEEVEQRMSQGVAWLRDAYTASQLAISEERQRRAENRSGSASTVEKGGASEEDE